MFLVNFGMPRKRIIYLSRKTENRFDLVDVRLHYNLYDASLKGADYDLTTIFEQTLVKNSP